jgi:capsular polysaccharide transport system permease protein
MQLVSEPEAQSETRIQRRKRRWPKVSRLFLITVVLPTIISSVYFGLIASDVYVSESRFVVRGPRPETQGGIGALLQGAGFSSSEDDIHSVHDYALSRDALEKLNAKLNLDGMFKAKAIDVFSRFAPFGIEDNFESLYRYYQNHVALDADTTSSISVLQVRAYNAGDAFQINKMLLDLSENLVNQLNERGRQDTIRFATSEVAVAEQRDKAAALALAAYRNQQAIFDPERQSTIQLQLISKLQDDFITTTTQLAQVRSLAPNNPQVSALQKMATTLQAEMDTQMARVAGSGTSLTNKSAEFARLTLDQTFADKQLGIALASLEQARNDAQRKQLYLERIVQPNKPDAPIEPRRLRGILTTLALGLIVMGILNILIAGIREHKD